MVVEEVFVEEEVVLLAFVGMEDVDDTLGPLPLIMVCVDDDGDDE